jgi:hypothetical protein
MKLAECAAYRRQKSNGKRILMEKMERKKRLGADGNIILKRNYENRMKGFEWIYLAQEKDK